MDFKIKQLFVTLLACVSLSTQTFGITSAQLEASIRAATTGAGTPDFTIAAPAAGTGLVVDASTMFGVSPTNSGLQNYNAFASAIAYCKANSASKLTVPKGTY